MLFWSVKDGQLNAERKVRDGGYISAGTEGNQMVDQVYQEMQKALLEKVCKPGCNFSSAVISTPSLAHLNSF